MSLKSSFVDYLNKKYPKLQQNVLNELISDQLLSEHTIQLPLATQQQLQTEINAYQKLYSWGKSRLIERYNQKGLIQPNNFSACTSYDFHINETGQPKLIEINTNAAFLALGLELYLFHNKPQKNFNVEKLVNMFKSEARLCQANENIFYILDEKPTEQRLYVEFLLFKEIFLQHQIECHIIDLSEISTIKNNSLVYNRYTDFYLHEEKSSELKALFNTKKIHLTPQPLDYFLLADKERMFDWNLQTDLDKPTSLLNILDLGKENNEDIWLKRKNLFFKPKSSYGSKQAYKGANISRKTFEQLFNSDFIAQDYVQASEVDLVVNNVNVKMKYDLRCYAYQADLQLVIARLYQGQTTNLRTEGGGFALVDFI